MIPFPLVPFFQISLKNSELKTTDNTFRDCRVHFFRQPFSKQLYAELQESSISRLSWSFVKESAGLFIPQKLRSGVHRISQQSYESYIILRDRIVELAWSKVSTKVCGFKFGSIKLHLTSKRIKEILTQKSQYKWKYLFQFNDKNGFRR